MKHLVKKAAKLYGKYFVFSYTIYGVSELLKHNSQNMKSAGEYNGKSKMELCKPVILVAVDNFKETVTNIKEYLNR